MPRPEPIAHTIDQYLAGRESPMAGQGVQFVRAGKKYGVDPRLLVGIATIESSAGAKLARPFNAFNWGIHQGQQYGSWEESILDAARGLRRGYIDKGLTDPAQIVSKYAPASDGNDESNWASVVGGVMKQLGGKPGRMNVAPTLQGSVPLAAVAPPTEPEFSGSKLSSSIRDRFIAGGGSIDLTSLPGLVQSAYVAPPSPPPLPPGVAAPEKTWGGAAPLRGGNYADWVGQPERRTGPSAPHQPSILNFVGKVGMVAGRKLTPWGNESHSLMTVNGKPSAHGTGHAADIPASGKELIRLGRAALVAAGMPPAQAAKAKGGLYNIGGHQVIFATNVGGNHFDHVHVGERH